MFDYAVDILFFYNELLVNQEKYRTDIFVDIYVTMSKVGTKL